VAASHEGELGHPISYRHQLYIDKKPLFNY